MLLFFVFGFVLLPKAFTMKCYECLSWERGSCTGTERTCPTGNDRCRAFRVITYNGNSIVSDMRVKGCAAADACVNSNLDFGVNRTAIVSTCCDSDLCNYDFPSEPKQTQPNGKKCYRCDGQTCTGTLNCKGDENFCVSAMAIQGDEVVSMKGCATKQACSTIENGLKVSCCEGNYCNSAISTSAGVLILVTPLISLISLF